MKASSMAAIALGMAIGAGAAAAFGLAGRSTQRRVKKLVRDAGRKTADEVSSLMG